MSLLHRSYFADVREMRRVAFEHICTPIRFQAVRQANGEYVTGPVEGQPIQGALVVAGSEVVEEAAAMKIEARWLLKLPLGTIPAEQYRVTGITGDVAWTEMVRITGHMKGDRINQRLAAVDV